MKIRLTLVAIGVLSTFATSAQATEKIADSLPVTLATVYDASIDVTDYWQSEKLDGIRAIWNGKALTTRNGKVISAPPWFTRQLPDYPLEGELWAGRGNFHLVQQTVLDKEPNHVAWRQIKFMLFDVPHSAGDYPKRYFNLVHLVDNLGLEHIQYIEHTPIESEQALFSYLDSVADTMGEGIMLRKITSRYQAGRSSDLLKLKKHQDAEALVVGYKVGNGRLKGKMGALLVQMADGRQFYIGSGFSDAQRVNPPQVGAKITFRYNGLTHNGIPKFARYIRERID
ncbi:DNA ligase [Vibrio galatheae]|uniref:DNA ligase n=1 Tax=Vibrio galatheae TaxID=579748 RepID=A0A0F4NHK7_9VIBR|nr:DNA ligase [Vibrio galatheae]KJY81536.1 DNA ligase [Vibrio galatheae]